jgi:TPR repeat protein
MYAEGQGVRKDPARARQIQESACHQHEQQSCSELARLLEEGNGGPRDALRAAQLYASACDHDIFGACLNLGMMYRGKARLYGTAGLQEDLPRARELFEKACAGKNGSACFVLAEMQFGGEGGPVDKINAAASYETACDIEAPLGCYELGMMVARGDAVAEDEPRAARLLGKACKAKPPSPRACDVLRRACRSGSGPACEAMTK